MIFLFFFWGGQESCHIHPGNRPLTSCVSESDLAGYLCQRMMAVWLQVGQTKSVPAQNADGDQPALCTGMTPVTQAWALYHIFTYVCWFFCWLCICEIAFLSRHQICCTELERATQKVAVKNIKNFVMLVKIKGPSVCYALCALCPKSKWEFELPKGL